MRTDRPAVITPIQGLRALAAWIVVVYHLVLMSFTPGREDHAVHFGAIGVDLFFVISGFIMVYTTAERAPTTAQFWRNRLIRIAPLYWGVTIIFIGLSLAGFSPVGLLAWTAADATTSLLFLPTELPDGRPFPLVPVGWTLIYEMFFYALFGLALQLRSSRDRVAAMTLGFVGLVILTDLLGDSAPFWLKYYGNPIVLEFAAGCVFALVFDRLPQDRRLLGVGAALVGLGFFTAYLAVPHVVTLTGDFREPYLRVLALGAPSAVIVFGVLLAARAGWVITNRVVLFQGEASYSLYLVHMLALHVMVKALEAFGLGAGGHAQVVGLPSLEVAAPVAALTVCAIAGAVAHLWFERPATAWLRARRWRVPALWAATFRRASAGPGVGAGVQPGALASSVMGRALRR